jgi:hypothetical protein
VFSRLADHVDSANSEVTNNAAPIRGGVTSYFFALFFLFFFLAMALFLGVGVNFGRVGSSRGLIALDLSLGPRPLTDGDNDTEPVPIAIKKRK